jgi:redox-sensitive bicupin YhaK (pirin superfamily)
MLNKINSSDLYTVDRGWLITRFHFSFAEYHDPDNMNFGALRVLNDDIVKPETGFGTHPHENMEIVSYCVDGELTHADSMGSKETLTRGEVQYMSAGTGITHSEMNDSPDLDVRLLQIWILPDREGHTPVYGSKRFKYEDRHNRFLKIVGEGGDAITINQDVNMFVSELDPGTELNFKVDTGRQAYMVCIEGGLDINGTGLSLRDALEITGEESLTITAESDAHLIIIEMAK